MLKVATYNLRFTLDRWPSRKPFCLQAIKDVDADVYGLQEVNIGGRFVGQNVAIGGLFRPPPRVEAAAAFLWYLYLGVIGARLGRVFSTVFFWLFDLFALSSYFMEPLLGKWCEPIFYNKWLQPLFLLIGVPFTFGNAIVTRSPSVSSEQEVLRIGSFRVAQRVMISSHGNVALFCNTHLLSSEGPDHQTVRAKQAADIVAWMASASSASVKVHIVVGDFNCRPTDPAYDVMVAAGYVSAYRVAHGREPSATYPTALRGPSSPALMDAPKCIDYIWVKGPVAVVKCSLFGEQTCGGDATLSPSDHAGIEATLKFL